MMKILKTWIIVISTSLLLTACETQEQTEDMINLKDFATRYAAAWSAGDPDAFAAFYTEDASFRINDGEAAVGRQAIAEVAGSFMASFPDMHIQLVEVREAGEHVEFHWHWTGTNNGPGGTGAAVDITGYERWTLGRDGLIRETWGHMDDAEYQRQLQAGATATQ